MWPCDALCDLAKARLAKRNMARKHPRTYHVKTKKADGTVSWQGGPHLSLTATYTTAFCRAVFNCWLPEFSQKTAEVCVAPVDIQPWNAMYRKGVARHCWAEPVVEISWPGDHTKEKTASQALQDDGLFGDSHVSQRYFFAYHFNIFQYWNTLRISSAYFLIFFACIQSWSKDCTECTTEQIYVLSSDRIMLGPSWAKVEKEAEKLAAAPVEPAQLQVAPAGEEMKEQNQESDAVATYSHRLCSGQFIKNKQYVMDSSDYGRELDEGWELLWWSLVSLWSHPVPLRCCDGAYRFTVQWVLRLLLRPQNLMERLPRKNCRKRLLASAVNPWTCWILSCFSCLLRFHRFIDFL